MSLFAWPPQTLVNRVVPKSKLYANVKLSTRLRDAFVSNVQRITWRAKLAPETIRLAATSEVTEIQVFELTLRTADIHREILLTIDKAIPFPILFELSFADKVQMAAAWKRPASLPDNRSLGHYIVTPWLSADAPRANLPVALDMRGLYEQLIKSLSPYPAREGESLGDHMERLSRIRVLEADKAKLEQHLARERQFNRKVEINARLRAVRREIAVLTAKEESKTDGDRWIATPGEAFESGTAL